MARTTTTARSTAAWKAAAAAGTGIVLLGAGGVTFAEWSDAEQSATGTEITSGALRLDSGTGTWTNAASTDVTAAVEAGTYLIVPGDTLTYAETLTVDARGDLLRAAVGHTLGDLAPDARSQELVDHLEANASMTLNGAPVVSTTRVTARDEVQDVAVAVTIAFDDETAELTAQNQTVTLSGLDITLTQDTVTAAGN